MLVYLVRHGQTSGNLAGILQGQLDVPLNQTGIDQAVQLGRHWHAQSKAFDAIWSSDLSRASQTADLIAEQIGSDQQIIRDPSLRERHLGSAQGKTPFPGILTESTGLESLETFNDRLIRFFDDQLCAASLLRREESTRLLVVTSNGAIKRLATSLLERGYRDLIGYDAEIRSRGLTNCSFTVLDVANQNNGAIIEYNDATDLATKKRAGTPDGYGHDDWLIDEGFQ